MNKEYLKMPEGFDDASQEYIKQLLYSGFMTKNSYKLIAHAVSSHNELVAEVERLRGAVDELERENENISAILLERTSALGPYI